jgi:hypothetical protein
MSIAVYNRIALGNLRELTTPTVNRTYLLGSIVEVEDTTTQTLQRYMYVKAYGALTVYQPYVMTNSGITGSEVTTSTPFTLAAPGSLVCVPQVAFPSGYYGFVLIQGTGKVMMSAETYALGDMLQILNNGVSLVVDGSSGAPVLSVMTSAVCRESGNTAIARNVYLFGRPAVVSAT